MRLKENEQPSTTHDSIFIAILLNFNSSVDENLIQDVAKHGYFDNLLALIIDWNS